MDEECYMLYQLFFLVRDSLAKVLEREREMGESPCAVLDADSGAFFILRRMLRFAARRAATAAAALSHRSKSLPTVRSLATGRPDADPVAVEMVSYALTSARSQKSDEAYSQALLILEQGVSNLRRPDGGPQDGVGMALLAMSTLLYERGKFGDSIEKLQEDVTSSVLADECLQFVRNAREDEDSTFKALHLRAIAVKGLTDLVIGDLKSRNVALSHGEFLHASGDFSAARDFYQKALQASESKDFAKASGLAAANMDAEILSLGAICARGQVATHLGYDPGCFYQLLYPGQLKLGTANDFQEAEETLTKALTKAEEYFAIMFGRKAALEQSSSLLIQEVVMHAVAKTSLKWSGWLHDITGTSICSIILELEAIFDY
ncbi:hypothetical protein ACLOJK_012730 [Asimina triloba]